MTPRAKVMQAARERYADDDIELHEEQDPDKAEGGYWVHARVWVPEDDIDE